MRTFAKTNLTEFNLKLFCTNHHLVSFPSGNRANIKVNSNTCSYQKSNISINQFTKHYIQLDRQTKKKTHVINC